MAGLFGLSFKDKRERFQNDLFWGTFYQQHLGEEFSGIAVFREGRVRSFSRESLFRNSFAISEEFKGSLGIGYCGPCKQPFATISRMGRFALCFSGDITNLSKLVERFKNFGHTLESEDDEAEILAKLIAQGNGFLDGLNNMNKEAEGSYSLLLVTREGIYAVRSCDAHWPLTLGCKKSAVAVASDSSGFDNLGFTIKKDIKPGEIVFLKDGKVKSLGFLKKNISSQLCSFLFVYTNFPAGKIEDISVFTARKRMGSILAGKDIEKGFFPDVITAIPDSGRGHAIGYYQEFIRRARQRNISIEKVPFYDELLMKFSHTGRSFTPQSEEVRAVEANYKLLASGEDYNGKVIVVCDDSVVRGTQIRNDLVPKLRRLGVAEIHFRISSPKIYSRCPWKRGVKKEELLAAASDTAEQIRLFGIESLEYNDIKDLQDAIGIEDLCFDCMIQ